MKRLRAGSLVVSLTMVSMVIGSGLVVMALSSQSSSMRSAQAATTQGRYATIAARSAVDECLAEFSQAMRSRFGARDMRAELSAASVGGIVPESALGGPAGWSFVAKRTLLLLKEEGS